MCLYVSSFIRPFVACLSSSVLFGSAAFARFAMIWCNKAQPRIASNRRWDMMRSRNHPKPTCFTGCLSHRKTRYSLKDRPLWTLLVESSGTVSLLICFWWNMERNLSPNGFLQSLVHNSVSPSIASGSLQTMCAEMATMVRAKVFPELCKLANWDCNQAFSWFSAGTRYERDQLGRAVQRWCWTFSVLASGSWISWWWSHSRSPHGGGEGQARNSFQGQSGLAETELDRWDVSRRRRNEWRKGGWDWGSHGFGPWKVRWWFAQRTKSWECLGFGRCLHEELQAWQGWCSTIPVWSFRLPEGRCLDDQVAESRVDPRIQGCRMLQL